jgi:hypothetical protein
VQEGAPAIFLVLMLARLAHSGTDAPNPVKRSPLKIAGTGNAGGCIGAIRRDKPTAML